MHYSNQEIQNSSYLTQELHVYNPKKVNGVEILVIAERNRPRAFLLSRA